MKNRILGSVLAVCALTVAIDAQSAVTLYSDRSTFLAALPPAQVTTYDFETASGFPAGGAGAASYVGSLDSVTFIGVTHGYSAASSGTQAFSGVDIGFSCCFGIGAIDFTSLPQQPYAAGFFGEDLTTGEIIRVNVGFSDGSNSSYNVSLGAAPDLTPVFFGLVDSERSVRVMQFFGANEGTPNTADRAWLIDDMTIATIPLPGAWVMLGSALAVLMGRSRRHCDSSRT